MLHGKAGRKVELADILQIIKEGRGRTGVPKKFDWGGQNGKI